MHDASALGSAPLLGLLSPQLQEQLLAAARPVRLHAQEWLFREGDPGDCLYVLESGRVRVVVERDDELRVLTTLGPGAALGELAVLTGAPRSASVVALRDSDLLEIDGARFEELLHQEPELGAGLARALADRLQRGGTLEPTEAPVAVVAVATSPGDAGDRLWNALQEAFGELGSTTSLSGQPVDWPDPFLWGRGLGDLERSHAFVLLRAGLEDTAWSSFALRQADRVLALADGTLPPTSSLPAGSDLVFLGTPAVAAVAAWAERVSPRAQHVVPTEAELAEAAHRIARRLTGRSLGLVLSGGGARAFAHIGVLDVLSREGIVVDRFGGCSMGAFVGAMAALGWEPEAMVDASNAEIARRAPFGDYTFPRHALIRARRAAAMLKRLFGDTALEQLARPLYTVSADLLSSRMIVHRTGELWEVVGASMAIPGLAPPVPRRAELLVDGGILNNLPIDVMVEGEKGPVLAVDVMRRLESVDLESGGDALMPTILETLSRATVLGSVGRAEANRKLADVLVTPDVQDIPLRGFRHLSRAVDAGRRAAEEALADGLVERLERVRQATYARTIREAVELEPTAHGAAATTSPSAS